MAPVTAPDLLDVLRERRTQAQRLGAPYGGAMVARDTMLYWLARAAKTAREEAGRKQVHVAASLSRDQSTIYRFEKAAGGWPRDADAMVAAYADDLDIDPIELWEQGLKMWRDAQASGSGVTSLSEPDEAELVPRPPDELLPSDGGAGGPSEQTPGQEPDEPAA